MILCLLDPMASMAPYADIPGQQSDPAVHANLRTAHLAAELILHGEINEANAGGDQGIDEADRVQLGLELRRHHPHEDLTAQRLNAVFPLHALSDPLCVTQKQTQTEFVSSVNSRWAAPGAPPSPSELQLFLNRLCLMGVVEGSSTPENRQGPEASCTHFPSSWLDSDTCMGL